MHPYAHRSVIYIGQAMEGLINRGMDKKTVAHTMGYYSAVKIIQFYHLQQYELT